LNNSITKIWIVILILAATFLALIYWGVKSYNESAISIQRIVNPDNETILTNDIFKSVIQSDLHLNNFILTGDTIQRGLSRKYAYKADSLIHLLDDLIAETSVQQAQLDTLKDIIIEKSRVNTILIELKKRQNSHFFTAQALDRIKKQISDTAFIDKSITQRKDLITRRDTVELIDVIANPDDYKGISGFFRKLFGKERIQIDTIKTLEEQLNYSLAMSVDSSIIRNYFIDTTLLAVKSILIEVLDDEIQLQKKLYAAELEIITYNELLLQNIRMLLEDISMSNEAAFRSKQEEATHNIEKSQKEAFIIAGAGLLLGFLLLFFLIKDITQTNMYRNKLELEKERAEQLAAAKEIFLSKMSHEIRTPLHSISGFTNLLEKEITQEKQRKLLNGISYANHYLNELINNILEQAKINSGTYKLEKSNVYIPQLCREMELLFKPRMEEQNNSFNVIYSDNLEESEVIIDKLKLKQVLLNLLGNAFKFTKDGTVFLKVNLLENSGQYNLEIKVADTGVGIDPKHHTSIFQPFNKIVGSKEINISGSGLGLSISKYIVESLDGNIKVESEFDKGSVFTINLPVTCEPYKIEQAEDDVKFTEHVFYPINVLAIEDDDWNAYLLENYLSDHVQELKICHNAEDALVVFHTSPEHYQLLLTDLNLPKMDGRSLLTSIISYKQIPVIALSASLSHKEKSSLIELGFSDAVSKPFDQADLMMVIDKIFHSEAQYRNLENQKKHLQIDLKNLSGFLAGDKKELEELYSKFTSSFESKVEAIQYAAKNKDMVELARMAHQLKSNCEQIGIDGLSECLQSIEVFSEIGNQQRALEELNVVLPQLEQIVRQLQTAQTTV
jgi:signal transduction histidine kinase/DNA-binding NarL/FixJ family response regulator